MLGQSGRLALVPAGRVDGTNLLRGTAGLHAGHAGAASGGGHFKVTIVAPEFSGLNRVARHRAIYGALNKHFPEAIHALTIQALTPSESTS